MYKTYKKINIIALLAILTFTVRLYGMKKEANIKNIKLKKEILEKITNSLNKKNPSFVSEYYTETQVTSFETNTKLFFTHLNKTDSLYIYISEKKPLEYSLSLLITHTNDTNDKHINFLEKDLKNPSLKSIVIKFLEKIITINEIKKNLSKEEREHLKKLILENKELKEFHKKLFGAQKKSFYKNVVIKH